MKERGTHGETSQQQYLEFVDGLRAVAILAVVGYHIGVPGFAGGFIGVDVFFVISGFLIINQIKVELESSRFSLLSFYARRNLRILPAFIFMLLVVVCLAPFILPTPDVYFDFAVSSLVSPTVLANVFFYLKQGYFDLAASQKPLLHTWTLAVEEQFYLVAPLLLMVLFHLNRKRFGLSTLVIAFFLTAVSLAGAVLGTTMIGKNPAFYLMHWRAWEFIAGGALVAAVPHLRRAPAFAMELLGGIGFAAVALATIGFNAEMAYPSWRATVPVMGAIGVILASLVQPGIFVAKIFGCRPLTTIGLVSYGWYLWHWPILSLMRILRVGEAALLPDLIGGGGFAFLLACVSYRCIEQPIRTWGRSLLRDQASGRIVAGGVAASLITALFAGAIGTSGYYATKSYVSAHYDIEGHGELDNGCRLVAKSDLPDHCLVGHVAVLLGDSHAAALSGSFTKLLADNQMVLVSLTRGGCNPLWFAPFERKQQRDHGCSNFLGPFERLLELPKPITAVIIESAWDPFVISRSLLTGLVSQFDPRTRILVIGPVPWFHKSSLDCIVLSDRQYDNRSRCTRPRSDLEKYRQINVDILRSLIGRFDNVRFIDPFDLFCDATTCMPFKGNQVFYRDGGHLTPLGAEYIYDSFPSTFQWLSGISGPPSSSVK